MKNTLTAYSKAPIICTSFWADLAVHSMYCRTGISARTYNRNFRVGGHASGHVFFACSKLEAKAIYQVKQACGNDK